MILQTRMLKGSVCFIVITLIQETHTYTHTKSLSLLFGAHQFNFVKAGFAVLRDCVAVKTQCWPGTEILPALSRLSTSCSASFHLSALHISCFLFVSSLSFPTSIQPSEWLHQYVWPCSSGFRGLCLLIDRDLSCHTNTHIQLKERETERKRLPLLCVWKGENKHLCSRLISREKGSISLQIIKHSFAAFSCFLQHFPSFSFPLCLCLPLSLLPSLAVIGLRPKKQSWGRQGRDEGLLKHVRGEMI